MRARVERLDDELAAFGPVTEPEALTGGARQALHPAVSPDGGRLVYVRSDGRSDPRLVAVPPAGGDASTLARTNHLTRFDFLPDGGVVFSQREFTDRYRHYSDIYVLAGEGTVRRVTEGARIAAPSAGPGGGWAVAVMDGGGTNGLVRVDLGNGVLEEIVAPAADTYWAWPAVSPDGRWIAASRWAEGRHDVVVLDADGRTVHAVTRDRALDMAPAWSLGRTPPGLVVRPHRHPQRPRGRDRPPHRPCRPAAPPDQRAYGGGVPERRPRRRVALLLGLPRRRLGDRARPVRARPRPARARAGRTLRRRHRRPSAPGRAPSPTPFRHPRTRRPRHEPRPGRRRPTTPATNAGRAAPATPRGATRRSRPCGPRTGCPTCARRWRSRRRPSGTSRRRAPSFSAMRSAAVPRCSTWWAGTPTPAGPGSSGRAGARETSRTSTGAWATPPSVSRRHRAGDTTASG